MSTGAHEHSTAGVESQGGRRGARRQKLLHGNFYMVAAMTHTHGWSAHPLKCRPNQPGIWPRGGSGTRLATLVRQAFHGERDSRMARGGWAAGGPEPGGAQS